MEIKAGESYKYIGNEHNICGIFKCISIKKDLATFIIKGRNYVFWLDGSSFQTGPSLWVAVNRLKPKLTYWK